jgi:V/A-type H+-transporting ATPase subunit C
LIPVGTIFDHGLLEELSAIRNLDGIIELLCYCKMGGYIPAVEGYEPTGGMKSKLLTEARLDSEYYKSMLKMARGIKDGAVLSKAIGLLIDLTNLQIASRSMIEGIGTDAVECTIPGGYMITEKDIQDLLSFKLTDMPQRLENPQYKQVAEEILISYGKTSNIIAVDETIDRHKFRLLKELLSPRLLSPLVMAWYLILKEFEMRNLRLILKTIADGIPTEAIKEYLVL